MNRERFLVKSLGDNPEGVREGLVKLIQLLDTCDHAVIVVPQLRQLKQTILADVLGEENLRVLIKTREINFPGNKKISLCSQATLKDYEHADAYLALWGSQYTIEEIEALHKWKAVILVTWERVDSAKWEANNRVSVIYQNKKF